MNQPLSQLPDSALEASLKAAMPSGELRLDDHSRSLYAQDVYTREHPAAMVLRPGNTEELAGALRLLHEAQIAVIPHGGGMSYTGGLLPQDGATAVIDFGLMNRIFSSQLNDSV